MDDSLGVGRLPAKRYWFNKATGWLVALGGAGVIGAITLIFAYLIWVVGPIFVPGSIASVETTAVVDRTPILVDVSENGEIYTRISAQGVLEFYTAESGDAIAAFALGVKIKFAQRVYPTVDLYAIIDDKDRLSFIQTQYIVSFRDDVRKLTPKLVFPYTKAPIQLSQPADSVDVHLNDSELVVAFSNGTQLKLQRYRQVEHGVRLPRPQESSISLPQVPTKLILGPRNKWIYLVSENGDIDILDIATLAKIRRVFRGNLLGEGQQLTAIGAILGRYSLLVGDDNGDLTQWGILKNSSGYRLEAMREFSLSKPVRRIISEPRRKGFATLSADGTLSLLYPTSGRLIDSIGTDLRPEFPMVISPRSDLLVTASGPSQLSTFALHNEHPEFSFSALWGKVWYEGYEEPIYSWQSSSADNDFEPKFSLIPLAFGTLKAAFYALAFAVPIAIMGAIYTAYFMAPSMRAWVKPGIEIMAALPTVILGFIGGLWLAPIIEDNLSSVLSIFVFLPTGLFLFAIAWSRLPHKMTRPLSGWYGLLVTPLIIAMVAMAFAYGPFMELQFFGGDSKSWFREVMGLSYDQRNSLVVGIVMGLAVIPTIFSIAEDAIYGVPTHLIHGSLALGATPWQTLIRVVMLTASPGIFSAVMIGMGRAVGETMIVLMATGNTPLMEFNIFEGMRTFAANIAVELPESEVNSSHYRLLFLAALVLFILTFLFNTFAEVVRQRLRARYGSL